MPFDDSGMTPVIAEAYRRVRAAHPSLPPVRAIRVNPNLRAAKLWGQYVDGVIEVNPDMTDVDELSRLLLHELSHAGGADEPTASGIEKLYGMQPAVSHATVKTAGIKATLDDLKQKVGR